MKTRLIRTAREMLSIANELDDLGMFSLSSMVEDRATRIISAQTGVNELVAPNLLDPKQVDDVKQKRDEENDELEDMLDQDEETVQEQQGLLEDHEDQVQNPLMDIVKR